MGCFYAELPKTPVQSRSPQRVVISVTDSKISLKFSYLFPGFLQRSFFQGKIRQDQEKNMR